MKETGNMCFKKAFQPCPKCILKKLKAFPKFVVAKFLKEKKWNDKCFNNHGYLLFFLMGIFLNICDYFQVY